MAAAAAWVEMAKHRTPSPRRSAMRAMHTREATPDASAAERRASRALRGEIESVIELEIEIQIKIWDRNKDNDRN